MENLSSLVPGLTGKSSMAGTNTISATPPFQPGGSPSESTDGVTPGWPAFGSPGPHGTGPDDANARYVAGTDDRGGVLPAAGQAPGDGSGWENVNDRAGVSGWTTTPAAHYRDDRQ